MSIVLLCDVVSVLLVYKSLSWCSRTSHLLIVHLLWFRLNLLNFLSWLLRVERRSNNSRWILIFLIIVNWLIILILLRSHYWYLLLFNWYILEICNLCIHLLLRNVLDISLIIRVSSLVLIV